MSARGPPIAGAMFVRFAFLAGLVFVVSGCASATPFEDETTVSSDALTDDVGVGASLTTTTGLNLRSGPSTDYEILLTMPEGAVVKALETTPTNGFYHVEYEGTQGWASGNYLRSDDAASPAGPSPDEGPVTDGETCKVSYYGYELAGNTTSNGERFDPSALTAAHKTLPFNTKVRVTNLATNKTVTVRINDRGPFVAGRCLDLSQAAFQAIGPLGAGVATVRYAVLP
jgi:uncharacterized protein YgiM (DUF1202 family)